MNNPSLLSPMDRLSVWREFRENIVLYSEEQVMDYIIDWWSVLSFVDIRTIDIYDSELWPTPWELVYYGEYCQSAISLGMAYTLVLMDSIWINRLKVALIDDHGERVSLVVLIDDKYFLNYSHREVIKIKNLNFKILELFSCNSSFSFSKE